MSKIVSFEVGENKFFDLTKQEMKGRSGYNPTTTGENKQKKLSTRVRSSLPTSLDWRTKGAVTHVKNQGACGSCWAFAAAAGAESALIIRKNATKAIDLSEQYLIECSLLSGCNGTGNLNEVMNLVLDGVPTEQSYPYDYRNTHPGICTTSNKLYIASSFIEEYQLKDE